MTKDELKQLTFLKKEVNMLKIQIEEVEEEIKDYQTCDSVKASQTEFPYTQHSVSVSGIAEKDYTDAQKMCDDLNELKLRLKIKKEECKQEYFRLNNYILSIDDSLIRQILTYKYIKNLTWTQVAQKIGEKYTGNYVRVTLDEYLKKHC